MDFEGCSKTKNVSSLQNKKMGRIIKSKGDNKMNKLIEIYLQDTGKRFRNLNDFWARILNDSKGRLIPALIDNGITRLNQLERYLAK